MHEWLDMRTTLTIDGAVDAAAAVDSSAVTPSIEERSQRPTSDAAAAASWWLWSRRSMPRYPPGVRTSGGDALATSALSPFHLSPYVPVSLWRSDERASHYRKSTEASAPST